MANKYLTANQLNEKLEYHNLIMLGVDFDDAYILGGTGEDEKYWALDALNYWVEVCSADFSDFENTVRDILRGNTIKVCAVVVDDENYPRLAKKFDWDDEGCCEIEWYLAKENDDEYDADNAFEVFEVENYA